MNKFSFDGFFGSFINLATDYLISLRNNNHTKTSNISNIQITQLGEFQVIEELSLDLMDSIENIMSKNFCSLKTNDTIADALSIMTILDPNDLYITDNENKLISILNQVSLYSMIPPSKKDILEEYRHDNSDLRMQTIQFTYKILKESINTHFDINQPFLKFPREGIIKYGMQEIVKLQNKKFNQITLPVINNDETIAGTVTSKDFLKLIRHEGIFDISNSTLIEELKLSSCIYNLDYKDSLDLAYFAVTYTSNYYLLILDQQKAFRGLVDKLTIHKLAHVTHQELLDIQLDKIMQPIINLSLVSSEMSIKNTIHKLLSQDRDFVIVVDDLISNNPQGIITAFDILQFFLSRS